MTLKIVLVAYAAAFLLVVAAPAGAAAACSQRVLDDWAADGTVDGRYSGGCYSQALRALPSDLRAYSSAAEDIVLARQRSLSARGRRAEAGVVRAGTGDGLPAGAVYALGAGILAAAAATLAGSRYRTKRRSA